MKNRFLLSTCIFFLVLAINMFIRCTPVQHPAIEVPSSLTIIQLDSIGRSKNASSLSDSVSYIRLQTSSNCLVGKIEKIAFSNNKFVILGSIADQKTIYVFNKDGNFLYKIYNIDPISNLNASITDFDIVERSDKLYVYFEDNRTVAVYDINQHKLLSTYVAPPLFTNFSVIADTFLFFRDGISEFKDEYENFRVCKFDLKGNVRYKWMENPLNRFINGGQMYISKSGDSILIGRVANDTIFSYKNSKISALYKLSSDIEFQGQFSKVKKRGEFVKLLTDSQSTYLTGHIFDTKENLYFYYKRKSYISLCTINKADQSNYFLESINNDINSIVIPLPEFINENYFVSIVYPYLIKKQSTFLSSTSDFQSKYRDLKQLSDRLSYDDNPVICLMHLKN